jgi:hypothetical protein
MNTGASLPGVRLGCAIYHPVTAQTHHDGTRLVFERPQNPMIAIAPIRRDHILGVRRTRLAQGFQLLNADVHHGLSPHHPARIDR